MTTFPFSIYKLKEEGEFFIGEHLDMRKFDSVEVSHDSLSCGQSKPNNDTQISSTPNSVNSTKKKTELNKNYKRKIRGVVSWSQEKIRNLIKIVQSYLRKYVPNFYISCAKNGLKCLVRFGKKIFTFKNIIRLLQFFISSNYALSIPSEFEPLNTIFHSLIVANDVKSIIKYFTNVKRKYNVN